MSTSSATPVSRPSTATSTTSTNTTSANTNTVTLTFGVVPTSASTANASTHQECDDSHFSETLSWVHKLSWTICELKQRIEATYSLQYNSEKWAREHDSIRSVLASLAGDVEPHRQYLCELSKEYQAREYRERLRMLNEKLEKTHRDALTRRRMLRAVSVQLQREDKDDGEGQGEKPRSGRDPTRGASWS